MIHEIASIDINSPVEKVFDFMSDPRNRTRYDPDLIEVRQTPQPPMVVGTRIVEVRGMLGIQREMVTEVSELEQNQLIAYRTLERDPTNAFGSYRFDSIPEGTRLTLDFTLDPKGITGLFAPLMARGLKRDIQSGLENIKAVLEV